MANLLYRLGRFSARRAWTVIAGWVFVLAVAGASYLALGGTLASSFSIPGTETERVTDRLGEALPELTGATGQVVFATDDGGEFTEAQQEQVAELLTDLTTVDGVNSTVNPFDTEADRADQEATVTDGIDQVETAQQDLDNAEADLDAGQSQLDDAIEQAKAAGLYEAAKDQFDDQQQEIDDGRTEIDENRDLLDTQAAQLADARTLLDAAADIRTVSADGSTAVATVAFDQSLFDMPQSVKDAVADRLDDADIAGVSIDYNATIATSTDGILGVGEIVGVIIAAVVLLVMLRALLPTVVPLITSLLGVGVGVAGSMAFSDVVDMASITPVLGVMLGLAVGIDYSLFILNRHRRQLKSGMDLSESIGLANGTSGNAVVFAGSTVVVALLALNVTGIPFLGVMGTVGAVCVLVAVAVSISLTPALLGLIGLRVLNRKARNAIGSDRHTDQTPRPMRTVRVLGAAVLVIAALLVIAIPALSMRLGLPDGSSEATDSTQYRSYTAITDKFGAGQNGALLVVAELPSPVAEEEVVATQADMVTTLMDQPGVVAVAPAAVSQDRQVFVFQAIPQDGPSSESTQQLVTDLRALSPIDGDVELGIAGQASGNIDVSQKLADALPIYLAVVVGLSLLIMAVVFRSILVPLVATGGFVLSLFAALGAITAIYQWGWLSDVFDVHDPGPVLSFGPIIIMGVLFGLAMDYQLFLVSGMREAWVHGMPARSAVVAGLRNGRAVVTAAAIIMASVFGGFVFSHLSMIRPLGFGLAVGVLFDAFVVRMVLVPAVIHLLGKGAWWFPKWLDRIVPDVDVEGAALERSHPVAAEGESSTVPEKAGVTG